MFSGLFGTRTNADDELKNAKTTEQQVSAINNILSKKAASKPIFSDNTSDKQQVLKDISDKLYTQNGSRIVQKGNEYFIKDKDGKYTNIDDGILNSIGRTFRDNTASAIGTMIGARNGSIIKGAIGAGAGGAIDMKTASNYMGQSTANPKELAQRIGEDMALSAGIDLALKYGGKPAINIAKGTLKAPLEVLDKGLTGIGARHILSQNIGGAQNALKANLGGDHEFRNALDSAKDALGADLDNFVRTDLKTIDKTSDNRYIQKGIDIANSAINRVNETLKGLNVGRADAELLLSALGHENGVKNILDAVANNPQSAQKITEISSNLNKSFAGSINEQLAKFKTQTPKDSFKNSFNQVKKDYADTKDFLVKNSNYQSDFKELNDNLATILSDTQNINTRGVFNALNGGGNLENLLNAKNAINEQLGYIISADFKSSSDFINQKALNEAKSLIDNEINTALKNDENLINLYKSANGDYATMKNIVDSNLMNQISRDGKTSLEALNAMIKSNENINGVTLNEFLSSLGAKDRAIAEANIIKGLMEKNSVNGVVDFRALNQSLNSLDFGSEFAKELKSQILNRQALLNNTSDILNALGSKVVKSKSMSQGISTDPLKRAETMKANFIVEQIKPLIPRLGNNEALKLHLNRAILNANGDFKLAIKNIDNIPDGNLPTPTRNLLNEFKAAVKEIEKQVVKADNQAENQVNLANQLNGGNIDSLTQQMTYLQNALKGDGFVTYPNSARQETAINQNFNIQEWVKNMSGVISDEWRANLTKLAKKHPEMFRSEADVFRVIKEIKDNPTHFFKNYDDDVALIGKQINDNKFANIGIVKNDGEIIHANKNKIKDLDRLQRRNKEMLTGTPLPATTRANNSMGGDLLQHSNAQTIPNQSIKQAENQANLAKKENERLLKRNSYPVGSPTPTQLTFGKTAEPTANGAKALLGKKEKAVSGDALPPHLDADNISLTGRYSVGGKPHLTAVNENIIPQNAKNEVKEQTKSTQINEQAVKTKAEPIATTAKTAERAVDFSKAYSAIKNIGKYTGLVENDYKKIASLSTKDFTQRLKNDIQAYEELAGLQEIAYKATNGLLYDDEYVKYFNVRQGQKGYLAKAQSIHDNAFEILDQAPNYISGLYNEISRLKALKSLSKEQDEALNKALKQVNLNAVLDTAGETNYKLMATKIKTALNALTRAKKILDEATPTATAAKDLTADAPSELYKAHRKAQKAKETTQAEPKATTAKPQEPTPQAKADEVDINPKSNYKKHERPIELDFKEAIDKGFNVDINALKHFYKNSGNSPLNYMREYMAELDQIEKKALGNEAKDRLKKLYEDFFYSVKAVETHKPNQIAEYSSIGGQKEFEKIKEFRNEIEKAPTNQKALDALEKIEFVNNLENSPAFKLAKRQKTMKKEFVKEARNALKQATNLALKPLSQFLIKYGKSEEFLTKSSIISKIELENARDLRGFKLNIRPIKEFGTNYAEFYHDGANAIKKLLTERQGQVAGAFEREELGDIDLVWGEITDAIKHKGYGLSHILDKRMAEFMEQGLSKEEAEAKAIELINKLPDIIKNGEIEQNGGRFRLQKDNYVIGLTSEYKGEKRNWIITAFERGNPQSFTEADFKAKSDNLLTNPNKNSTPKEIKSQELTTQPKWANKFKTKMAKMGQEYNDEKIANLANWHKDSDAVTKESDGSPKVFYHGTNVKFDAFDIDKSKGGWLGKSFYFTDGKGKAKGYGKNVISTYLNLKNPYISKANDHYSFVNEVKEQFGVKENYGEFDPAQVLKEHGYDGVVYKDWDDEVGTIYTAFSPNQIKSITNKGTFNPKTKMMNGFSTMAMEKAILHLGSGGMGGVMNANAEQDPNKKAEAFVKGFLLGAGGSVGAIKMLENSAKLAPQLAQASQRLAKDLPMILNDRPDIIGKALGQTPKENYNYIFGGENAIGANKAKLKTAVEMAKNGADESQIWAKTGWYKDIDKKWKFEINPKGGELKENAISNHITKVKSIEKEISELEKIKDGWGNIEQRIEAGNKINELKKQKDKLQVNVGDILDDKMLFTSYPELKNIQVVFNNYDGGASYGGKIELSRALEPTMMKSVLYHELQHEIQIIERFANGGGYFADKTEVEELLKKYPNDADLKKLYDGLENDYIYEDAEFNVYNKLAGEAEARNVQTRLTANSKEHPNKTLDINPNDRIVKYDSYMSASYTPKQKEVRGVYNVAFNEKRATQIYKDIEDVENVIKFEKGRADNITANKDGFGSLHIQKHLDPKNEGYITTQEYLNMGEYIRKAGDFKESGGKRVYDYTDENGVRFRAIIGDTRGGKDRVISFFSNRKAGSAYDRQNYTRNQPLSENSTPKEIKSQAQVEQKAKQYAKWLSQADKIPPQAPDELYKAYDKAKRT